MADERGPWGIMAGPGGIRARDPDTFHLHTVLNSTNAKGDLGRSQILDAAVRHERNPSALLLVDDFQAAHSAVRPPKLDEAEGKDKDDTAAEDLEWKLTVSDSSWSGLPTKGRHGTCKGHFLPKLPVDKEDTHDDAVREGPLRKSVKERKIEYCFQDIEWWWFQNGGNQVQKSDSEGQPGA
jgi:hypothetical protein